METIMGIFKRRKKDVDMDLELPEEEYAPVQDAKTPQEAPAPMEVNAMEEKPSKKWIVNCMKCGAALNLKEGGQAYICPVCGTLLRIKTGTRLVKDLGVQEKQYHVTLTESAINSILARRPLAGVDGLIGANTFKGYENGDSIVIDVDENGKLIKKS